MNKLSIRFGLRRPVLWLLVLLTLVPQTAGTREFKPSRYIEPNQMSTLFTRHVRKGIIKRIGLTDAQLHQIRDAVDPYRDKLLAQLTEFKDSRVDLVYAISEETFDSETQEFYGGARLTGSQRRTRLPHPPSSS